MSMITLSTLYFSRFLVGVLGKLRSPIYFINNYFYVYVYVMLRIRSFKMTLIHYYYITKSNTLTL